MATDEGVTEEGVTEEEFVEQLAEMGIELADDEELVFTEEAKQILIADFEGDFELARQMRRGR